MRPTSGLTPALGAQSRVRFDAGRQTINISSRSAAVENADALLRGTDACDRSSL